MRPEHDQTPLGLHSLGLLDPLEQASVDAHITWCEDCRAEAAELTAVRDLLSDVPPEAFLEGPPENAELLVRRTLRTIRQERGGGRSDRGRFAVVGVAAAVAAAFAVGTLTGHLGGSTANTVAAGSPSGTELPANTRTWTAANVSTGVRMSAQVIPESGWVQVRAHFFGVPPGKRCRLIIESRAGDQEVALSWIAPRDQTSAGVALTGAAVVAPDDIGTIKVVTFDGRQLVAATS
jgi:hypothetical protein